MKNNGFTVKWLLKRLKKINERKKMVIINKCDANETIKRYIGILLEIEMINGKEVIKH